MGLAEDFDTWKQQKDMSELSLLGVDPSIQYTADQAIKDYSANQDSDNVNILHSIADTASKWFLGPVYQDAAEKTLQWEQGAVAGINEMKQANQDDEMPSLSGVEAGAGGGITQEMQPEEKQSLEYNQKAANDFYEQTVKPAAFVAGMVKGAVAAPVMAGDLIKMMREAPDPITGTQNVLGEFSGYNAVKKNITSGNFAHKMATSPVTTASELLPAFLIGRAVGGKALDFYQGKKNPASPEVQETVQAIVDADKTKQVNDAMVENASKSKIADEEPEVYEQIVQDAVKGTPMENIYIPEETFKQYFVEQGIDPYEMIKSLDGTVEGGNVSVPYAKFLSTLAKSEHAKALSDNVKFSADGLTQKEAVEVANAVNEHYSPNYTEMRDAAENGDYRTAYQLAVKDGNTRQAEVYRRMMDWQKEQPVKDNNVPTKNENTEAVKTEEGALPHPDLEYMQSPTATETAQPQAREQGALPQQPTLPKTNTTGLNIEPVTRKQIDEAVKDIVMTRFGRVGNKFLGIFKVDPEVARLRSYGDFDTLAHEVGHYLDKKLSIKDSQFDAELIAGADKVWGNDKTYQQYTPAEKRAEGVAEFTRQYLISPNDAKVNFPAYFQSFTNVLRSNKPMEQAVNTLSNRLQAWFNQSSEARGRGAVTFGNETSKSFIEKVTDGWYKVYEKLFDDKVALSRMVRDIEQSIGRKLTYDENAYLQSRMANTSGVAKARLLVEDKNGKLVKDTLNKEYNGVIEHAVTLKEIVDGLKNKKLDKNYQNYLKIAGCKDWHEAFSVLLTAKRQVELQNINPDYKGPILKQDAERIIANAPKELEDLTQKFYDYNDNILKIAVDSGLVKQEIYNELKSKYKHYASMARDFSSGIETNENAILGLHSGKGLGNAKNPLKKLTEEGSTNSVVDPLESAIKNTYTVLSLAERNKAAQTFIKLSQIPGIGKYVEHVPGAGEAGKNIFTVMINGEKEAYQTTPEIYQAVMSMNTEASNALVKLFSYPTGWLRAGATLTPDFVIRNLSRDTFTAAIYSKNGFFPIFDTAKGFAAMIGNKDLYYEYVASGAKMSTFVGLDRDNLQVSIGKLIQESVTDKYNPMEYLRAFSEAAETATRLAEFEKSRKAGKSIGESGLDAKDVTLDFSRGGSMSKTYNKLSAFFNATMQGTDRLARAFYADPVGFNIRAGIYITIPSVILWTMNHDQDWYKELPAWQKDTCWIFKANNIIWRIPKPFEPGIIYGSLPERMLDWYYNKDKKAVSNWAKSARDGFLPNFLPTAITPIIEWYSNYSFFRDKNIVPERMSKLPSEYQFSPYTSELAKRTGNLFGASPMKIDNTIQGYTGSLGKVSMTGVDYALGKYDNLPAREFADIPIIKSLTTRQFQGAKSVDEFYEKLNKVEGEYQAHGKTGNPPKIVSRMRDANEKMKKLNKQERDTISSDKLSPEDKRTKLDEINLKRLEVAKKALEY